MPRLGQTAWTGLAGALALVGPMSDFASSLASLQESLLVLFAIAAVGAGITALAYVRALRKKLEQRNQELALSEERWRLAMRNDGLFDWDARSGQVFYSPRWKQMLGFGEDELPDTPEVWEHLLHPEDRERVLKAVQLHQEGKMPAYVAEYRLRTKSGAYKWVLARGLALRDSKGRLLRMVGSHVDIDSRKQAELALEESRRRFESLVNSIEGIVWELDVGSGRFNFVSSHAERMLGYPLSRWVDIESWRQMIHPDDREWATAFCKAATERLENHVIEYRMLTAAGREVWVRDIVSVEARGGRPVTLRGLMVDVTERVLAQQQLRLAKEQAEAASRAKSEFLATMSHEIRTPMNGVLGAVELLMLEEGLTAQQKANLGIVRSSAEALLALLNDILDLSRIEAGKLAVEPSPCDLRKLTAEVIDLFDPRATEKGIELSWGCDERLPAWVEVDGRRVRQMMTNLVGNAVKFTERGFVRATIDCLELAPGQVTVRFLVEDSGVGVPANLQSKLFQKFSQADSSSERRWGGAGLGLAITRELAELMGGQVGMESEPGRGSRFWFILPAPVSETLPQPEISQAEEIQFDGRNLRVLLAEDNAVNQMISCKLLERLGCHVEVAANGLEAVRMSLAHPYDVIFMDCQMPEMDGYKAASMIRRARSTPIIALTASAMPEERERCLRAGMDDFLAKPVGLDALRRKLVQWARPWNQEDTPPTQAC